jgi:hypothetical protein
VVRRPDRCMDGFRGAQERGEDGRRCWRRQSDRTGGDYDQAFRLDLGIGNVVVVRAGSQALLLRLLCGRSPSERERDDDENAEE